MSMIFCSGCGKEIHETARDCPHCGANFSPKFDTSKKKSSAAIWCFFLGGFGAHKFYMGKTGLGFLYLLFCWTLIPAFVAIAEFIMLLCMSEEEFARKCN